MNLEELKTEVKEIVARDDLDHRLKSWINRGLERVVNDATTPFRSLEVTYEATLDPGVRTFTLPMGKVSKLVSLYLDDHKLIRIVASEYDRLFREARTAPSKGRPTHYTRYGNMFEFYPIPVTEHTLFLRYEKAHKKLEKDSDVLEIPYTNLVVAAAVVKAFTDLLMPEEATYWHQVYQSELRSTKNRELRVDGDLPMKLEGYDTNLHTKVSDERDHIWEVR